MGALLFTGTLISIAYLVFQSSRGSKRAGDKKSEPKPGEQPPEAEPADQENSTTTLPKS